MSDTIRQRKAAKISSNPSHNVDATEQTKYRNGKRYSYYLIQVTILAIILVLTYAYYTSPISARVIHKNKDPIELLWANHENEDLNRGSRILTELEGPESVVIDEIGNWYTGTHDGRIIRISSPDSPKQTVTDITSGLVNGPYSAGGDNILIRPLGLRLKYSKIYIADAYQGIFAIDLNSNRWEKIIGYNEIVPELKFPDDLVLNNEGTKLYFTDMSDKWPYDLMSLSVTEGDCSGRVIEIDLKTKITRTLRSEMCFPNGIELNPEETILVVSEAQRSRVVLLNIENGEIIREIPLPGGGDNVRRSKTGGYWVPIPTPPLRFMQFTRNFPFIRDIIAGILGPKWLYIFADFSRGQVVKLNNDFHPVSVHTDSKGKVSRVITEVVELDDGYLLCSFLVHGFVKLIDLPANNIVRNDK